MQHAAAAGNKVPESTETIEYSKWSVKPKTGKKNNN